MQHATYKKSAQEFGLIAKKGLGEILTDINNKYLRWLAIIFIFLSLFVGNSAYESGNISGTSMGIESFIGKINFMILGVEISIIPLLIGIILIIVVGNSTYKIFEKVSNFSCLYDEFNLYSFSNSIKTKC